MWADACSPSNPYLVFDNGISGDLNLIVEFRLRRDDSSWVNFNHNETVKVLKWIRLTVGN
jgi:hypothetical protein